MSYRQNTESKRVAHGVAGTASLLEAGTKKPGHGRRAARLISTTSILPDRGYLVCQLFRFIYSFGLFWLGEYWRFEGVDNKRTEPQLRLMEEKPTAEDWPI